jgi:HlyD family secretion protein
MEINTNHVDTESEELEKLEFRSEEVREILVAMPHWTVRSGSGYLLTLILLALTISFFIRYPDIIRAPVVLTTPIPPVNIISKSQGYLTLWIKDKEIVKQGAYLGFIQNPSDTKDALSLLEKVDSFKSLFYKDLSFVYNYSIKEKLKLGELQGSYNAFVESIRNYQFVIKQASYRRKANNVEKEIQDYQTLARQQKEQNDIMSNELKLARLSFERDSILLVQKVISRAEFEQKQKEYLSNIRAYKTNGTGITSTEIQKTQLSGRLKDLLLDEQSQNKDLLLRIETTMNELDARLKQWEQMYMLKSPINGQIAMFSYWTNNQFVKMSEEILSVIPTDKNFFAKAKVPVAGSGKIKAGEKVNIKLDNYPATEYGIISGIIEDISSLPRENNYSITIQLPMGLLTTYGKTIEFNQEMTGQAEIITEDLRVFDRVFFQVRKLFQ